MQTFTKNEVAWMLEAIKLTTEYYKTHSKRCAGMEASLAVLRAEQLTVIPKSWTRRWKLATSALRSNTKEASK